MSGSRVEAPHPLVVADHHDAGGAWRFVFGEEISAAQRLDARNAERRRGHFDNGHGLG